MPATVEGAHSDADAFSFVLRLWIEEDPVQCSALRWRGHITNVLDGRRRWVQSFHEIEAFIAGYLAPDFPTSSEGHSP
jgi:hypothetical protein